MLKSLSLVAFASFGVAIAPIFTTPPLDGHQPQAIGKLEVMVHLNPNGSPYAGKPSKTWFMLMQRNDNVISSIHCDCNVAVYNVYNQAIADHLPLSVTPVAGHHQAHQVIRTTITFPHPGTYTVVLSGHSTNGSFTSFVLRFPVKVRPPQTLIGTMPISDSS